MELFAHHVQIIAIAAIILTLIGYTQYFRSMFAGKTKPHMFSWIIWASLTAIAYFAQIFDNAGAGSWVTALTALISFFIAGYAYFYGEKNITRSDWLTFIAGLTAIPIWLVTENALYSVIIVTMIDALGFWPTMRKSWAKPHEETLVHYTLAGLKFALACLALENISWITALYPLSLVIMNWTFLIFVLWRRHVFKNDTLGRAQI
jgi:hypothetical protein